MKYAKKCLLFAMFVMVVASVSQVTFAAPDEKDVTVIAWQGAPGCTAADARIHITNDINNEDYDYKVLVVAATVNDENGNEACAGGGCSTVKCECTFNETFEAIVGDDEEFQRACVLPNCQSCPTHCDNTSCSPVGHCTIVSGYYSVTWYRDHPDGQWYIMSNPAFISITEKQSEETCP